MLKTTFVNIIDPIKSASNPYSMASTNAFPAVDIPASRTAIFKAIPPIFNQVAKTKIIRGEITSLMIETTSESLRFCPTFLKSSERPMESIISGIVAFPK